MNKTSKNLATKMKHEVNFEKYLHAPELDKIKIHPNHTNKYLK